MQQAQMLVMLIVIMILFTIMLFLFNISDIKVDSTEDEIYYDDYNSSLEDDSEYIARKRKAMIEDIYITEDLRDSENRSRDRNISKIHFVDAYNEPNITFRDDLEGLVMRSDDMTFNIHPIAEYESTVMLKGTKTYYDPYISDISAIDAIFVWGEFIFDDKFRGVSFEQKKRYAEFSFPKREDMEYMYQISHISNNRLIFATPELEEHFEAIDMGDVFRFEGKLVDLDWLVGRQEYREWKSSNSLYDKGLDSSEIIYVEGITTAYNETLLEDN